MTETNQIDSLGSNILLVTSATQLGGFGSQATSSNALTLADATALENTFKAPDVKSVSPVVNASQVTLTDGDTTYTPSTTVGTTPGYQGAHSYTMAEGSWFTSADETNHSRVLVVGPTVVSELFSGADPVGDTVKVNGTNFEIVGVTASKGSNGSSDQDDTAIAPLTAIQDAVAGYGSLSSITVQAKSRDQLDAAQTEVEDILNAQDPVTSSAETSSGAADPPTPMEAP